MKCSKCGTEFDAKFCPECGTPANAQPTVQTTQNQQPVYQNPASVVPQRKKGGCLKGGLIILAILVIIVAIAQSCSGGSKAANATTNSASTPAASTASAPSAVSKTEETELSKALSEAKKVDYKKLHKDYMDNAIGADSTYKDKKLILTGKVDSIDREIAGNPYITFNIDTLQDIRIDFDKGEEEKVGKLKKGQTITIVGTCKGTLLSTSVLMTDCLIVDK